MLIGHPSVFGTSRNFYSWLLTTSSSIKREHFDCVELTGIVCASEDNDLIFLQILFGELEGQSLACSETLNRLCMLSA